MPPETNTPPAIKPTQTQPPRDATAEAKLPPVVIDAITQLFKDGLPDPRGCEYREIEIAETPKWAIKTHGWVLPEKPGQQHAIGWNGVIYPVKSVGAPVDLRKEFTAGTTPGAGRFRGNGDGWPMSDNLSLNAVIAPLPIRAAFLERLGQMDLAEKVWDDGCAGDDALRVKDPYADMAAVWLGRWFNQAIQAFLNGDYASAAAICRNLSPVEERVRARAVARGIADPWPDNFSGEHLWQLPILQADAERRAQERPYVPVLASGQPAKGPERIAALIRDLETVSVVQFSNPGDVDVGEDPTVQALVKEGDAAVEPLLTCLMEDDRLTESRYTEGMWYDGPIIPVYEAAYRALFRILDVSFPVGGPENGDYRERKDPRHLSREDRWDLTAKLRSVWEKTKGKDPSEIAYATLQDDSAGADEWFKAVDHIVQPVDGSFTTYRLSPATGSYSWHTGSPSFARLGDSLREKTNPSVSDLIILRFENLVETDAGKGVDPGNLTKLLLALAAWDGKNHLEDLRRLGRELDAKSIRDGGAPRMDVHTTLCEKRLQLGDDSALQDYADYMATLTPDELEPIYQAQPNGEFYPILWHYPDDPRMQKVAEKLFTGKDAHLVPLPNCLVPTPLIGFAAFRQELARGLDDKSAAGTVKVDERGLEYQYTATRTSGGESSDHPLNLAFGPAPGTTVTFRICDLYAHGLSQNAGFPECQLYWPEAKRDEAVAICKTFLQQYGDDYRGRPEDPYDDDGFAYEPSHAQFRMAQVDHPAMPEEVTAGKALFSLSGTTRIWKMPTYPLGPAWQAEEVLVDGKWERYFGVLGNGVPVKVPASEIDLSGNFPMQGKVTKEISGEIDGPQDRGPGDLNFLSITHHPVALGAPVPMHVDVYNHSGLDLTVPDALMIRPGASKTLPQGIGFSVTYSDKVPPLIQRFSDPPFDYGTFQDLPLRKEVTVSTEKITGPEIDPTRRVTVLEIDLRDYFDLSRRGTYKVRAVFQVPGQPSNESNEITFSIASSQPKKG